MGIDKHRRASKKGSSRDGGRFIALPFSVIDSPAFMQLSYAAKSLLLDIARQYASDNNGRLLATMKYLSKRGWTSSDVISRAKKELLDAKLIYETVKGHRPNRASWYAITWHSLDKITGYDAGAAERWPSARSGYLTVAPLRKNTLNPPKGVKKDMIEPSPGARDICDAPPAGAIRGIYQHSTTPSNGDHLDTPSIVVTEEFFSSNHMSSNVSFTKTFELHQFSNNSSITRISL
ncbi:hypothetical protein [Polynucleobacter sp. MWH-Aus1W21]|uniref:hypothetical protein n=1 Tax=Polynucleobacter sp. MWH-Aus1W21 TaxID=1855880 RepID=UPI001BFE7B53|nr:hypothetical protein [Polynucleobacter sp. MWH-Aus1W21]QWD65340.1 hypothetical protein ICW03_06620 [Polynucleobacter sp. MWH-Aus1W21]